MKSIFVSSTFRDMQSERDILAQKVIPSLNLYARDYGESIRFVDLRWGVNTAELGSEEGNKKVLSVCLDEIDSTRPYMIVLIGERYGWIPPTELLKTTADSKNHQLYDYNKSVTELEIEYGALRENADLSHCLFYFREPLKREDIPEGMQGAYIELDQSIEMKLLALKEKIKKSGALIKSYSCEWDNQSSGLLVPESFAKTVEEDVKNLFARDFEKLKDLNPEEREEISGVLFAQQKAMQFSARYPVVEAIEAEIKKSETNLFLMQGVAGSGKSTVMAKLRERLSVENETFFFASGNSSRSQTAFDLLKQIVYKLETLTAAEERFDDEYTTYNSGIEAVKSRDREGLSHANKDKGKTVVDWRDKFSELAISYTRKTEKPLYIIADALDQLAEDEIVKEFSWLPSFLPKGVTVVVSMLDSFEIPLFYPLQNSSKQYLLDKLSKEEVPQIITGIIKSNGKELSEVVIERLSQLSGAKNPLYISLALQRLLMLDSEDFAKIAKGGNDMRAINAYMLSLIESFPGTQEEMAVLLIEEAGSRIDEVFCKEVASLMSVSRRGLRITDLQAIFATQNKSFKNIDFSLFTKYLSNFFIERSDGRVDFTHRVIRLGLQKNADFNSENEKILNHLKSLDISDEVRIAEIMYHAYKADDKEFLGEYIEDFNDENIATITEELYNIAIYDKNFIIDLVEFAVLQKEYDNFAQFINFNFFYRFKDSLEEHKTIYEIMKNFSSNLEAVNLKNPTFIRERAVAMAYSNLGNNLTTQGEYDEAFSYYQKMLEIIESLSEELKSDETLRDLSLSYYNVGSVLEIQGEYREAYLYYQKTFEINKNLSEQLKTKEAQKDLSAIYDKLGGLLVALGEYKDAFLYYQKGLEISKSLFAEQKNAETMQDLLTAYERVGSIYIYQGEYKEALPFYQESLEVAINLTEQLQTPGVMLSLSVGYNCLGYILRNLGEYEEALSWYHKDLKITKSLAEQLGTPQSMSNLASSYNGIGLVLQNQGKYEEARSFYQKDLEIVEKLAEQLGTPQSMSDLAGSYNNIGNILEIQGEYEEALLFYRKYFEITEKFAEQLGTPQLMNDLAVSYNNIGNILEIQEEYDEALLLYKKSFEIAKGLSEQLQSPQSMRDVYVSYSNIGNIYNNQGDYDNALEMYGNGLELIRGLDEQLCTSQSMSDLSLFLNNIGSVYTTQGDNENALKMYQEAFEINKNLAQQLRTPQSIGDVSYTLNKIGDIYKDLGDNENALKLYQEAFEINENLAEQLQTPEAMRNLSVSNNKIGSLYYDMDENEKALSYFEASAGICERLFEALETASACQELIDAYYNCELACKYANKPNEKKEYEQKAARLKEEYLL